GESREFFLGLDQLGEAIGGGEAGRPGADDDDVDVQGLALDAGKLCHAFSSEGRNRAAFYRTIRAHMSASSRRLIGIVVAVVLVFGTIGFSAWRLRVAHARGGAGLISPPRPTPKKPLPAMPFGWRFGSVMMIFPSSPAEKAGIHDG